MNSRLLLALVAMTSALHAQTYRRQATLVPGGDADRGRCTVEIVVDGAAQIALRGDDATVTNLSGQPPELRRFECTAPLPPNPADFRFRGVDGRGHQNLLTPPLGGQPALVRIEDPENGSDRYAFEISWRAGGGPGPFDTDRRDDRRDGNRRFTTDQAVDVCKDAVRSQTAQRFRTNDVNFRDTRIDDAAGRGDWVVGTLEARHPGMPDQILKFSCSVNFETGQVRTAQVDPLYSEGQPQRAGINPAAVQNCRRAVEDKVSHDGYGRVSFGGIVADPRPDGGDRLMGDFQAVGPYGPQSLHFSCAVEMRDGDVRGVDITTRQ